MSKKTSDKTEVRVEGVEHALSRAEQFIEKYQKQIVKAVGAILVVIALYVAFQQYYVEGRSIKAAEQMAAAEDYFNKRHDWERALYGDGNEMGFEDIITEFRFTRTANLAKYYAGVCCLHLGEYEDAISYLSKFKTKDIILSSIALGGIGDAYAQLGENDKALSFYKKAAEKNANDYTSPLYLLRAGVLLEEEGNLTEAGKIYERIKIDYPTSAEGRDIDKYIARIKALTDN